MSFTHLKDLIPKAASKYQLHGELKAALVVNRASELIKEIFSEELCRHIRVKYVKNDVLWLSVSNSSVAQEVQMKSYELQRKLNESLGREMVKGIRSFQESSSGELE